MDNILVVAFSVLFIFVMTTLGAGTVFLIRGKVLDKLNLALVCFASGVMVSASIWSLLLPAVESAREIYAFPLIAICLSMCLGGLFIALIGMFKKDKNKMVVSKLFVAITMHNIPEGLAVGIAFGCALATWSQPLFASAVFLALGIGVQNFPEGMSVALPIKRETGSGKKAFLFGALSGVVEPIFAVVGIFLSSKLPLVMPLLLAFSAGSMLFVTVQELLPNTKNNHIKTVCAWSFLIGFLVMFFLDNLFV